MRKITLQHQRRRGGATSGAVLAALGALLPAITQPARGALTWDANGGGAGSGGTGNWDTTANSWFNGSTYVPWNNSSPQLAVFGGTAGTVSLTTNITATAGLQFDTANYVIQGNALTLGGTVTANADATISSIRAGTSMTKAGSGTLELAGSSTHTGALTVALGTLALSNKAGLGTSAGGTIVDAGATLNLIGVSVSSEPLTINGAGVGGTLGAIYCTGGSSTWGSGGGIVLNTDATIRSDTGFTINGALSGNGNLTIAGGSSVSLNGNNIGWTRNIVIDAGQLQVGHVNGLGGGSDITFANTGTITTLTSLTRGGTITLLSSGVFNVAQFTTLTLTAEVTGGALYKIGSGTMALAHDNPQLQDIRLNGGTLSIDSFSRLGWHELYMNNPTKLQFTASMSGTPAIEFLAGLATLDVPTGQTVTFDSGAQLLGNGGIVKTGTGTMAINSANSFLERVDVNAGQLTVGHAGALGPSNKAPMVFSGASIVISNGVSITKPINLTGSGVSSAGALRLMSGAATWNGTVTLSNHSTIGVDAGKLSTGGVEGTSTLTKVGAGELAATYVRTSGVVVSTGRLTVSGSFNAGTSRIGTVTASTGQLDLRDAKLIVTATGAGSWNGSAYTGVTGLIQSGRGDGSWNGNGVVTSMTDATTSVLTTLAVSTADDAFYAGGTFGGISVTGADVLVMYTWGGDADLNGELNGDDYFRIDSHIFQSGAVFGYSNGDFNYDGELNGEDYFIIDSNIVFAQNSPPFPTGSASSLQAGATALTSVPEPGGVGAIVALSAVIGRRRRKLRL